MSDEQQKKKSAWLVQLISWAAAFGCFYLVYTRIEAAALRESQTVAGYLFDFFAGVDWLLWLSLMIPYSIFFFLVDAHACWRVIRWFNAPDIRYGNVLPIRASAFILAMLNEQVGKGAMSLYLLRRHGVPGWEAVSSMIMLGMVEIYQLLIFSCIGVILYYQLVVDASTLLPLSTILPVVFIITAMYFPLHVLFFSGKFSVGERLRNTKILSTFRKARAVDYLLVLLCKAPNLLMAVVVYTTALGLFNVDVQFGQMLAFLPVIFLAAALPLPFHAGALLLWTVLFPDYPEVGAFSLVMHTFFVAFNAVIGLVFLPQANKELFSGKEATA